MPEADLLIRGARVLTPEGWREHAVAITEGCIAGFGEAKARHEVLAGGALLLPAALDAHVHYNEPGRTDWEGWATGSQASAAGGAACVFEMPLNAHPPTLDPASFDLKRAAAEAQSVVDFALWGGLTPVNLEDMEALADCGVIGFKAFMSSSGTDDFPRSDAATLRRGMARAAAVGLPVAVHAEDEAEVAARAAEARQAGRTGVNDYLDSRPVAAEVEAIRLACELAGETGCRLHVVHVSSGEGVAAVVEAKARGVDVTCETCPHYLVLGRDDVVRLGAPAKCAPPLRDRATREALLSAVQQGWVDTLGSDHSPAPPSMKEGADFFAIWGGISGCQHLLPLVLEAGLPVERASWMLAGSVAERFGLAERKGRIAPGYDADLVLVSPGVEEEVRESGLFYRHRISPYVGLTLRHRVEACWVRGQAAYQRGRPTKSECRGRLVIPSAHSRR